MVKTFICSCCRRRLPANPRIKSQRYCGMEICQRERKRKLQQAKMATDPDYRANQHDAYRAWRERNPAYWRKHRQRDDPLSPTPPPSGPVSPPVAKTDKMDTLEGCFNVVPGIYLITPLHSTRKMDAFRVKIVPFSTG